MSSVANNTQLLQMFLGPSQNLWLLSHANHSGSSGEARSCCHVLSEISTSINYLSVYIYVCIYNRITEYLEMEGTHKDHRNQLPAPSRTA